MINDAHCHFFSPRFFGALAAQRNRAPVETAADLCSELQWEAPVNPEALADRWVQELDRHHVSRTVLIASVPGDEESVAAAVRRHPTRFVGFFMLDPGSADAPDRARRAVAELGLKGICLFPAMHHVPLGDERVAKVAQVAAAHPGTAIFVHCGLLSVGVRRKLGLPSPFDLSLGDPLALSRLALAFPQVPFIAPHFGAGMLREVLMAGDTCPNLHVDTSSSNSWIRYTPGLALRDVFGAALQVFGPRRLLFGTDSSYFPRGWQHALYEQQKETLDRQGTSAPDAALIFGGNFERLFPAGPVLPRL